MEGEGEGEYERGKKYREWVRESENDWGTPFFLGLFYAFQMDRLNAALDEASSLSVSCLLQNQTTYLVPFVFFNVSTKLLMINRASRTKWVVSWLESTCVCCLAQLVTRCVCMKRKGRGIHNLVRAAWCTLLPFPARGCLFVCVGAGRLFACLYTDIVGLLT